MIYLWIYLIGAFIVMAGVPAIDKVFADGNFDFNNDEEVGAMASVGIFWPLILVECVIWGIAYSIYWILVKILSKAKTIYEQYQKQKYDDIIP